MKKIKLSKPVIIGLISISIAMLVLSALALVIGGIKHAEIFIVSIVIYVIATSAIVYLNSYLINIKLEHKLYAIIDEYEKYKSSYCLLADQNDNLMHTIRKLNQTKEDYKNKLDLITKEHKALVEKYNILTSTDNLKDSKIKELSETIKGYEIAYGKIKDSEQ